MKKRSLVALLIALLVLIPPQFVLAEEVVGTVELAFTIPSPYEYAKAIQGGCSDGTYYYQAFVKKDKASNEEKNISHIAKVDLKTGETVLVSDALSLNHTNDMTYNPKLDRLVVCHNNPHRTRLSFLDPHTLEVTETRSIPYSMFGICYNEKYERYVLGISGGQTFSILKENFKVAGRSGYDPTPTTKGYTTQGVACDDDFIYFVLYKENVITVYDWDGRYVRTIILEGTSKEPENIDIVNGEIYVSFAAVNAAEVYKINIEQSKENP